MVYEAAFAYLLRPVFHHVHRNAARRGDRARGLLGQSQHSPVYGVLVDYAKEIGLSLVVEGGYGLRPFLEAVGGDFDGRCPVCYRLRMRSAARYAAENGFTHFTTTLLISPYQNHELLAQTAREAGEEFGVAFLYRDFRPSFREGQDRARAMGLYMQKYCGCIFSEEDRYRKRKKPPKKEEA